MCVNLHCSVSVLAVTSTLDLVEVRRRRLQRWVCALLRVEGAQGTSASTGDAGSGGPVVGVCCGARALNV